MSFCNITQKIERAAEAYLKASEFTFPAQIKRGLSSGDIEANEIVCICQRMRPEVAFGDNGSWLGSLRIEVRTHHARPDEDNETPLPNEDLHDEYCGQVFDLFAVPNLAELLSAAIDDFTVLQITISEQGWEPHGTKWVSYIELQLSAIGSNV